MSHTSEFIFLDALWALHGEGPLDLPLTEAVAGCSLVLDHTLHWLFEQSLAVEWASTGVGPTVSLMGHRGFKIFTRGAKAGADGWSVFVSNLIGEENISWDVEKTCYLMQLKNEQKCYNEIGLFKTPLYLFFIETSPKLLKK